MQKRIEALDARAQEQEAAIVQAAQALAECESTLKARETELAALEAKAEEAKARVIHEMSRLSDVKSEQARLSAVHEALARQLEQLGQGDGADEEALAALQEALSEAQATLAHEREEEQTLKTGCAACEERVRALNARAETLSREVQVLMGRRQETGARLKLLKEMQRDYEGYQNSVKQVLLQARRTPGSGVHGVVADLIRVPEKLERAHGYGPGRRAAKCGGGSG